tara:strand:- start:731 stop:1150 length:420 start_codon:yes stop_codon:yes gene_type:complete
MSNSWSKEDRVHFENSEVMKQLEKNLIENYKKLESIQKKIAAAPTQEDIQNTKDMTAALKAMNNELNAAAADDPEIKNDSADTSMDADDSNDDNLADKEAVLKDLRNMVKIALEQKEYDLVYKIERTIDSISDKEVVCE